MEFLRTELTVLIVAGLLALMIFPILNQFGTKMMWSVNDQVCKESNIIHSKLESITLSMQQTGIECPADEIVLDETTKSEYYYDMYTLLKRCWEKTLGKDNGLSETNFFTSNADVVLVCYSVWFKDNERVKKLTGDEFSGYMGKVDPRTKATRSSAIDSHWTSTDNSHFMITIEPGEESDNINFNTIGSVPLKDNDQRYLVVFMSYYNNPGDDEDLIGPKEWSIQYEDDDWSKHTAIIPESSYIFLGNTYTNIVTYWENPK